MNHDSARSTTNVVTENSLIIFTITSESVPEIIPYTKIQLTESERIVTLLELSEMAQVQAIEQLVWTDYIYMRTHA